MIIRIDSFLKVPLRKENVSQWPNGEKCHAEPGPELESGSSISAPNKIKWL